jgi:hypothetical protein
VCKEGTDANRFIMATSQMAKDDDSTSSSSNSNSIALLGESNVLFTLPDNSTDFPSSDDETQDDQGEALTDNRDIPSVSNESSKPEGSDGDDNEEDDDNNVASIPPSPSPPRRGPTAYEKMRIANIEANRQLFLSSGLSDMAAAMEAQINRETGAKKPMKKQSRSRNKSSVSQPSQHQTRQRRRTMTVEEFERAADAIDIDVDVEPTSEDRQRPCPVINSPVRPERYNHGEANFQIQTLSHSDNADVAFSAAETSLGSANETLPELEVSNPPTAQGTPSCTPSPLPTDSLPVSDPLTTAEGTAPSIPSPLPTDGLPESGPKDITTPTDSVIPPSNESSPAPSSTIPVSSTPAPPEGEPSNVHVSAARCPPPEALTGAAPSSNPGSTSLSPPKSQSQVLPVPAKGKKRGRAKSRSPPPNLSFEEIRKRDFRRDEVNSFSSLSRKGKTEFEYLVKSQIPSDCRRTWFRLLAAFLRVEEVRGFPRYTVDSSSYSSYLN